jgi:hypothetical protein
MKQIYLLLVLSVLVTCSRAQSAPEAAHPQISALEIDPGSVTVLHLRPGYTTSVRLPEEISSVVIGNPASFKAEHSEAEPRLVFIKPTTSQPARSNALITTRSGQEVSLHLVSSGKSASAQAVDFLLEYKRPRSFLIDPSGMSSFVVADTRDIASENSSLDADAVKPADRVQQELAKQARITSPNWQGKELQAAIGEARTERDQMIVPFSVLNGSQRWIELLPPQIQLSSGDGGARNKTKAEPVAISDYQITQRRLAPGARSDGVVVFARPPFKESRERLMLQVTEANQVDRPIVLPLAFVAATQGGTR